MLWYAFMAASVALALILWLCGAVPPPFAVLVFFGSFAALNAAFLIFLWITSLFCTNREPVEKPNAYLACLARLTMDWILKIFRIRVKAEGMEKIPDGPVIIISNHLSRFDPMALYVLEKKRRLAFVSKIENMRIPIAGPVLYQIGFLPLERDNPLQSMRMIRTGAKMVRENGFSMGIYPEGTRNTTNDLLPFKTGAFVMAQKAGAPIAVTVIRGTRGAARRLFTRAEIEVLSVIPAEEVTASKPDALAQTAYDRIHRAMIEKPAF
ncbi:MAG: 1-acyl-sn-glycerol-3-phosphate acyltransferase [Clostridia bacterium]|nr:1-acyl-sn-glycerol-3-phosphate acyltransferase [Clostridia bacterium]